MVLSQYWVWSSKIVRLCDPYGARCMGHAIKTWSAICLNALHSQFGEGARPYLYMDEWNRPTPLDKLLSLTQAVWDKRISTAWHWSLGMKARSLDGLSQYSVFRI